METNIPASATPEKLIVTLWESCRSFGEIEQIQLYCHQDSPNETLCFIDMKGNTTAAALYLGAVGFGFATVCKTLHLSAEFRCARRPEGKLLNATCNLCRMAGGELVCPAQLHE